MTGERFFLTFFTFSTFSNLWSQISKIIQRGNYSARVVKSFSLKRFIFYMNLQIKSNVFGDDWLVFRSWLKVDWDYLNMVEWLVEGLFCSIRESSPGHCRSLAQTVFGFQKYHLLKLRNQKTLALVCWQDSMLLDLMGHQARHNAVLSDYKVFHRTGTCGNVLNAIVA